jgi:hypothetical protein
LPLLFTKSNISCKSRYITDELYQAEISSGTPDYISSMTFMQQELQLFLLIRVL